MHESTQCHGIFASNEETEGIQPHLNAPIDSYLVQLEQSVVKEVSLHSNNPIYQRL